MSATAEKITSEHVREALKLRFEPAQYALLWEVANGAGAHSRRFADAIAIGLWPSHGCKVEGVEIKVSRSDFLHEMKQPEKSTPIYQHCHHWWLACPAGMVKPEELPPTWGLLELLDNGTLRTKKKAPLLEPIDMPRTFVAALMRRHAGRDEDMSRVAIQREVDDRVRRAREQMEREFEQRRSHAATQVKEGLELLDRVQAETGIDFRSLGWRAGTARFCEAVKIVTALGGDVYGPLSNLRRGATELLKLLDESPVLKETTGG